MDVHGCHINVREASRVIQRYRQHCKNTPNEDNKQQQITRNPLRKQRWTHVIANDNQKPVLLTPAVVHIVKSGKHRVGDKGESNIRTVDLRLWCCCGPCTSFHLLRFKPIEIMRRMIIYHHYSSPLFINKQIVEVALHHNNILVTHTMKQFSDNESSVITLL